MASYRRLRRNPLADLTALLDLFMILFLIVHASAEEEAEGRTREAVAQAQATAEQARVATGRAENCAKQAARDRKTHEREMREEKARNADLSRRASEMEKACAAASAAARSTLQQLEDKPDTTRKRSPSDTMARMRTVARALRAFHFLCGCQPYRASLIPDNQTA